jgi:putative transposase
VDLPGTRHEIQSSERGAAVRPYIARLCGKQRNFSGEHFWARGYAVSTVGFELEQVRNYIREQEAADGADGQF